MVTNEGYIFSKEAILQYFLDQKKAKKQQLAEWEADEARRAKLVRRRCHCPFFGLQLHTSAAPTASMCQAWLAAGVYHALLHVLKQICVDDVSDVAVRRQQAQRWSDH